MSELIFPCSYFRKFFLKCSDGLCFVMIDYSVPYCNDGLKCTCMWASQHVLTQVVIHLHKIRLMDDNIDTFVNKESIFAVILCVIGKKLLIPSPYLLTSQNVCAWTSNIC